MTLAIGASAVDEAGTLPSEDDIRAQLDRIRSSPEFDAPERARKFLGYVIEEAIAGRSGRIKAYTIATEVFGREDSFDAQADPAVRIEAGRVRRALERYYLVAGREDPVIITMPKGGYVPTFTRRIPIGPSGGEIDDRRRSLWPGLRRGLFGVAAVALIAFIVAIVPRPATPPAVEAESVALTSTGIQPEVPRLLVEPFEALSDGQLSSTIARGLTDEVIGQIVKFKEIVVVAQRGSKLPDADVPGAKTPPYALQGTVRLDHTKLRLGIRLVQRSDQSIIWASNYDEALDVGNLLTIEAEVARSVVTALAQPNGIISQAVVTNLPQSSPQDWEAYVCTLAYYGYRADLDPQTHASVQACLRKAVERFPNYATAWALLSLTYIDELRFRYRFEHAAPGSLGRAVEAAARAVELDPQNVRALQAEMLGFYFRGQIDTALKIGARAMAINPNDTELAGEYGFRLALSGQWPEGCRLVGGAVERNPGPPGYFETALAVCSYISGDYRAAERWARLADMRANPIYHLILLAIFGRTGQIEEAAVELKWLHANAPELLQNIHRETAIRVHRTSDQARFIEGFRQAGLAVAEQ